MHVLILVPSYCSIILPLLTYSLSLPKHLAVRKRFLSRRSTTTFMTFAYTQRGSSRTTTTKATTTTATTARMSTTSNSNNDATSTTNVEEIRMKRLIALGLVQAAPVQKQEIINLLDDDDDNKNNSDDDENKNQNNDERKPNAKKKKKNNDDVIDLLDDDDDDESVDSLIESAKLLAEKKKKKRAAAISSSPKNNNDSNNNKKQQQQQPAKKKQRKQKDTSAGAVSSSSLSRSEIDAFINDESALSNNISFQVATWNVWFGPNGDGKPHPGPRMRTICKILKEQHETSPLPLYFIGFQELINELVPYITTHMEHNNYIFIKQPYRAYGCGIAIYKQLTILDSNWIPYQNTIMDRGMLYVRAKLPNKSNNNNNKEILFITTHLESYTGPQSNGSETRQIQLQEIQNFCNKQLTKNPNLSSIIITGDMNWDDERLTKNSKGTDPVMSTILTNDMWKDTWLESNQGNKKNTCYTYDGKVNPMLGNNLRRRFDRILIRNNNNNSRLQPITTKLLGTQAINDLTWMKYNPYKQTSRETLTSPSDHFGYLVQLQYINK